MIGDYLERANRIADQIPEVLSNRGLDPAISRYYLTEGAAGVWLFAVVDHSKIGRIERYVSPDVVHQLSTVAGGCPVQISNSSGLRYAVLLSPKPSLPNLAIFPGYQKGLFRIGIGKNGGEIAVNWADLGNVLVAGMTRSGKSNFLRLIVFQAIAEGFDLLIVDPDGSTFPDMTGHPRVIDYADNIDNAGSVIEAARGIMIRRTAETNKSKTGGSVKIPEFNRVLLIVDEYNGLVAANGGARSSLAGSVTSVAWGGLKFGIHTVLAGHEFTKDSVGAVAAQMYTRICFRVRAPSTSRIVAGRSGAERITASPGRALSNPFGWIQVYAVESDVFDRAADFGDGLKDYERRLVETIRNQYKGRVTFEALFANGLGRGEAERLRSDWERRGIAIRSPSDNNSMVLVNKESVK